MKVNKDPDKKQEVRTFQIELRAEPDATAAGEPASDRRTVVGYAAKFNSPSEDMGFIEIIEEGAFSEAIGTSDVRALFNHDPNYVFARSNQGAGTLTINEDGVGLRYQFDVPDTTFGNDFLIMLKRGDVSQSSFAFSVREQSWETKKLENGDIQYTRRIKKVDRLFDVSAVTYPAYPDTEVALRSRPNVSDHQENAPEDESGTSMRMRLLEAIKRAA